MQWSRRVDSKERKEGVSWEATLRTTCGGGLVVDMEAVVRREMGSKRVGRGKDAEKRLGMGDEGVNHVAMALISTSGGFCGGNRLGMMLEEDMDVKEGRKKDGGGGVGARVAEGR